ncbi:hypothetical protein P9112_005706 [Eukaryota sp. TZLM1-RC]
MTLPLRGSLSSTETSAQLKFHDDRLNSLAHHPTVHFHLCQVFRQLQDRHPHLLGVNPDVFVSAFLSKFSQSYSTDETLDSFLHSVVLLRDRVTSFSQQIDDEVSRFIERVDQKNMPTSHRNTLISSVQENASAARAQFFSSAVSHLAPVSGRRTRRCLPLQAVNLMTEWYNQHVDYPYPTEEEKREFVRHGVTMQQVNTWFGNKRRRSKISTRVPLHL